MDLKPVGIWTGQLDYQPANQAKEAVAELDQGSYPLGVKVSDRELAAVPLRRHDWHGEWNYTVLPTAA